MTLLRAGSGSIVPLDWDRFFGEPTVADLSVIERVVGPVLDVGCGPARLTSVLHERGEVVLGLDTSPYAVALAANVVQQCFNVRYLVRFRV